MGAGLSLVTVRAESDPEAGAGVADSSPPIDLYLDRVALRLRKEGLAVQTTIRNGDISREIGRHAIESEADLVVMATHGQSRVDRLLGRNIAKSVVRHTTLPVLLIRPTDAWTSRYTAFEKLLVCLDGSEGSEEILPWSRVIARHFGSRIILLTVPEGESEVPRLEEYLESVASALQGLGLAVEIRVTGSGAARTITRVAESEGCDLILMATRGRGAPEAPDAEVGSVTEQVVVLAACPVFAVTVLGIQPGVNREMDMES
jgi:nucleotide-binding universal stress UspA family protein